MDESLSRFPEQWILLTRIDTVLQSRSVKNSAPVAQLHRATERHPHFETDLQDAQ